MSQKTSISKPQKIKIDGLEYEVRTITQWNDKGRSGTIDDSLPITNKVQYKPGPTFGDPFPEFRDLAERTGDPKTNNGWSFRPVAGPAFKKALIEGGPNSLSTQLDTATQQQLAKDANVPIPRAQQVLNKTTTTKSNQALAADNQDPNAPAGGQNVAQADQSGDSSRPVPFDPVAFSNAIGTRGGTKTDFKDYGELIYPQNLRSTKQDIIKFDMLEYKPKKFANADDGFGFSERERNYTTDSKGTVILPIPSGISDNNVVQWGGEPMNAYEAELANAALSGITGGGEGFAQAASDSLSKISKNSGETKTAIAALFADAAVGTRGLLTRTTGAIINPNLELLFNSPQLRPFDFTFKLSARNPLEAKTIIKIIRFFKQGMSPIRSESNLFLKSPNTFKIRYIYRPAGENAEHPYIGKIKECALQSFSVNYTPEGQYATYQDGVMVSYDIRMQFQELEPVFNDDYPNDGGATIGY